ncbi:MAG: ATP-binding protein [bacterium]
MRSVIFPAFLFGAVVCHFLCNSLLFAQEFWYEDYRNGRNAIREGGWERAVADLQKALEKKNKPELGAETFANLPEDYLPYFWLGVAYFNQGEFKEAQSSFDISFRNGVIQQSNLISAFNRYQTLVTAFLAFQAHVDSLQAQSLTASRADSFAQKTNTELNLALRALRENNIVKSSRIINELYSKNSTAPELALFNSLIQKISILQSTVPNIALEDQFNAGLAHYLAGNYQVALSAFLNVAKEDKNYRQVESWIRHTLDVSNTPEDSIKESIRYITKTDTTSAEPIVVFTNAATTRSDSIAITGVVRDDLGVDYLEITINGKILRDTNGEVLRLRPKNMNEIASFTFFQKVSLITGPNRIVVSAYDLDPQQHNPAFPMTITRLPPIYKTSIFIYSSGAFILLLIGGMGVNRLVRRRIAFVNKYNPYIAGAPVLNEKLFFGREKLLKRIVNTLHNNSILISGPRRMGKTSIQHQLKRLLENTNDPDYFYAPVYIDLQGTNEEKFFATMMEDIAEAYKQIASNLLNLRIHQNKEVYSARDFSSDLREFLAHLQALTSKKLKLILLMDEVDELNTYSEKVNQKLRGIFMKTYSENLVAVMSGIGISKRWESEGSPWYNFFEEIKIDGIDEQAAKQLIREPVQGIFSYEEDAVTRIIKLSENIPYRIQKICVHVINRIIAEKRRRATIDDVEAVRLELIANESSVMPSEPVG